MYVHGGGGVTGDSKTYSGYHQARLILQSSKVNHFLIKFQQMKYPG